MINIVLGGQSIGPPVSVGVGRIHYGFTRWIGTHGHLLRRLLLALFRYRVSCGRKDSVLVVGAAGPMGQMHVIRALSRRSRASRWLVPTLTTRAWSRSGARPSRSQGATACRSDWSTRQRAAEGALQQSADCWSLPAALVAAAIVSSAEGGLIDIFAGIPAPARHDLDLDTYIARRCYMFGTSGSNIHDMKIMLERVTSGQLDTNWSVDAISGMAGAADGIAAVENRTMAGKIVVYPMLHDVELIALSQLGDRFPTVAAKLDNGQWCRAAEQELLRAVLGEREPA